MINKDFFLILLTLQSFSMAISKLVERSGNHVEINSLPCPGDKKCIFIDQCPGIFMVMSRNELPVHRLRQAICGYDETRPKICCDSTLRFPTDRPYPGDYDPTVALEKPYGECGRSLIQSQRKTLGTYPFVARIGFLNKLTGETKYPCSGSIINERTVLTTASCALGSSEKYKLRSVLVGEFDTANNPDCNCMFCGHKTRSYNVSYVVKYPTYDPETFKNNLALLRLDSPINFTVTAQPICVSVKGDPLLRNNNGVLVGWGKLAHGRGEDGWQYLLTKGMTGIKEHAVAGKSTIQQWLPMKILSLADCKEFLDLGLSVEMCAIGAQEPCAGFSGSPLVYQDGNVYFLVGILSYGSKCNAVSNTPTVFVNIPKYGVWIQENS